MNNEHQHVIRIHSSATTYTHSQSRHVSRALRSAHIECVFLPVLSLSLVLLPCSRGSDRSPVAGTKNDKNFVREQILFVQIITMAQPLALSGTGALRGSSTGDAAVLSANTSGMRVDL